MTLITPENELSRLEEKRQRIAESLERLAGAIGALEKKVAAGEVGNTTEAGKVLADIRYWLKQAWETEAEIERFRRKDAGIAHEYALDLERARSEIGCRLARLRPCCRS
jgi:hypothetical protein